MPEFKKQPQVRYMEAFSDNPNLANCTFELNNEPMSLLKCSNGAQYDAFSGNGAPYVNNLNHQATVGAGPLPPGRYYIVDRQSGGRMGWVKDAIQSVTGTDKSEWFALYRDDGIVDDQTTIDNVMRSAFRLHPSGPLGISEGCVTLSSEIAFAELRNFLRNQVGDFINGTNLKYYGILEVTAPSRANSQ
jgi:hypothetical protein